jgi:2Fe-2S ferredoxin
MSEEKTQGAGTATEEAPGENTVQVTFLPEGKTVQFENGKLPYQDHGKEQSILDVALNNHIALDHACGGNNACTTCHMWV